MIEIVYDILKCPHDGNLRNLYFENRVNDFLFEFTRSIFQNKITGYSCKCARRFCHSICQGNHLQNLKLHLTIQEISKQVGLNEYKLKAGFKQKFGLGIFECLLEARE
jgi:AraC-like DNA-binding protein